MTATERRVREECADEANDGLSEMKMSNDGVSEMKMSGEGAMIDDVVMDSDGARDDGR